MERLETWHWGLKIDSQTWTAFAILAMFLQDMLNDKMVWGLFIVLKLWRFFARCADWQKESSNPALERKLQVSCDGTEGKWILDPDAGGENAVYDEVILNGGSDPIGEPSCTGGGVLLEIPVANIEESGTQLVCDDPVTPADGMYKMGHPNTCILLCDFQLGMTINSELDEEGEAFFKNQAGNITEGSVVTCWGRWNSL